MDRTLPSPKLLVAGGAVVLASAAYAIGTQTGGGTADAAGKSAPRTAFVASGSTGASGAPGAARRGGPHARGRDLDAAAAALGVSAEKLRTALEELRPERGDRGAGRDGFATELAKALGVSTEKVTDALEAQKPTGRRERPDRGAFFAALGKEFGVSAEKVEAAFEKTRPARGMRGGKADMAAALAKELGVSEAKLEAAFEAVGPGGRKGPGGPRPGLDTAAFAKAVGVSEQKLTAALERLREAGQQEREAKRAAFTEKLADALGVPEAKVTEVLGERGPGGPGFGRRGHGPGGPGHHGGPRGGFPPGP